MAHSVCVCVRVCLCGLRLDEDIPEFDDGFQNLPFRTGFRCELGSFGGIPSTRSAATAWTIFPLLPMVLCSKWLGSGCQICPSAKEYEKQLNHMMRKISADQKQFERHVKASRGEEAGDLLEIKQRHLGSRSVIHAPQAKESPFFTTLCRLCKRF